MARIIGRQLLSDSNAAIAVSEKAGEKCVRGFAQGRIFTRSALVSDPDHPCTCPRKKVPRYPFCENCSI